MSAQLTVVGRVASGATELAECHLSHRAVEEVAIDAMGSVAEIGTDSRLAGWAQMSR
ncbi:MAG: hypothetical protein J0I11_16260 [Actinobacteria bacterium]|nr:hypothetical protein [Actinomycetota bacterium]